jgi:hypothetical protein
MTQQLGEERGGVHDGMHQYFRLDAAPIPALFLIVASPFLVESFPTCLRRQRRAHGEPLIHLAR